MSRRPASDLRPPPPGCIVLLLLMGAMLALCSCEALWMDAYRHQGRDPVLTNPRTYQRSVFNESVPPAEAADNLAWFKAHYYDKPLTDALNARD